MKRTRILTGLAVFLDAIRIAELKMVLAFVDSSGHTLCLWREPGSWLGTNDVAVSKARSAVFFEREGNGDLLMPGGVPVYEESRIVGGIGVAGSSLENDHQYAMLTLNAYLALAEQESGFSAQALLLEKPPT